MTVGQQIPVVPGLFGLASIRNRGAAFGLLQGWQEFFIVVTSAVLVGLILYLRKLCREKKKLLSYGLALILGGALGNFIDRVVRGEVVDMLEVYWMDFPIFNLADCFLWIGVALMAIGNWRDSRTRS